MEDYVRPPPAPPTSPVKEGAPPPTKKIRVVRTKKTKAKAEVSVAAMVPSAPEPNVNPTLRNGVNHPHANGNGMMTTRSRRGSAAVVIPQVVAPQNDDVGMKVDDSKWATGEPEGGRLSGPGSGFLDGPGVLGRNGLNENPGRTIYSSQRQADMPPSR
jgi:hypothetical protein